MKSTSRNQRSHIAGRQGSWMRETTANANPTDSFPRHHASWTSGLNRQSRLLHKTVASDSEVEPTCTDFAIKYKRERQQVCCLTQTCLPQILFCFSFKYMKLTADVVLKIINTSSPSHRGLLHFFGLQFLCKFYLAKSNSNY